jgi:hypothetical protein
MGDYFSKFVQVIIASALVIIAIKLPWPEANAQGKAGAGQVGTLTNPSFVVVRAVDHQAGDFLARCIALKAQDTQANCLQ